MCAVLYTVLCWLMAETLKYCCNLILINIGKAPREKEEKLLQRHLSSTWPPKAMCPSWKIVLANRKLLSCRWPAVGVDS